MLSGAVSILIGFAAGVSQEQIVAACFTYLLLTFLGLKANGSPGELKKNPQMWIALLGLSLGAGVLVCAPGNFVRMGMIEAPSISAVIERMVLYTPGAFFEIGTGSTGKIIWLGALAFALLYADLSVRADEMWERLKRGIFWWIVSLATLAAMAPATNFISLRTSFFAIIFLFIGFAAMTGSAKPGPLDMRRFMLGSAVLTILGCLVLAEAVTAIISNVSIAAEFNRRSEIVDQALRAPPNGQAVRVPFIATETAALTYVQSPEHDREFLANWGRQIGLKIELDTSDGAPLPRSFNPLKSIKFRNHM